MGRLIYNPDKMFTYIQGYANGGNLEQTKKALRFAREMHKSQKRKTGEPYVIHPLIMACSALSLNIRDDNIIATILLHDVVEDCDVSLEELPVNEQIKNAVDLLTFRLMNGESKEEAVERYYKMLSDCKEAAITKIIDRCHNVSSMASVFTVNKLLSYIDETKKYVMPLFPIAKDYYPQYSDGLFALKYHMSSVIDSIGLTIETFENEKIEKKGA